MKALLIEDSMKLAGSISNLKIHMIMPADGIPCK